jgi:hypothetical protein
MEGIDIQAIVRQSVKEYIRTADKEEAVRLARIMAREALERALADLGEQPC